MAYLQYFSICLELVIAVLFARMALGGRPYMWGLFLTFMIYVFYDLAREMQWQVGNTAIVLFFIATLTALFSAWKLYRDT